MLFLLCAKHGESLFEWNTPWEFQDLRLAKEIKTNIPEEVKGKLVSPFHQENWTDMLTKSAGV